MNVNYKKYMKEKSNIVCFRIYAALVIKKKKPINYQIFSNINITSKILYILIKIPVLCLVYFIF